MKIAVGEIDSIYTYHYSKTREPKKPRGAEVCEKFHRTACLFSRPQFGIVPALDVITQIATLYFSKLQ